MGMGGKFYADDNYIRWRNGASLSIADMFKLAAVENKIHRAV